MTSTSSVDRALVASSVVIAVLAVAVRLHDVAAYPAMYDFDASGHAVNVVDLLEGHLPNVRSWCGSHPPLYYGLGALLWAVLPERVPVHVTMRLLSAGAWLVSLGLVWRWLRRLGTAVDAAVVTALLLGVPGFTIASCMMTNDALCALFVIATLVRLLETPPDGPPNARRAALTGALAGLAATTKATGMAAIGMGALFYAWRARRDWRGGLRSLLALVATSLAIAGPHYVHLFLSVSGSPYAILGARAGSQEKEAIAKVYNAIGRLSTQRSFASLFHATLWGDPTGVFLPRFLETHLLARAVSMGGLIVMGVAVAGAVRVLMKRQLLRSTAVAFVFGVLYAAGLVPHIVDNPYLVLTKPTYMLPEALPLGILLAVGLDWARDAWRLLLRLTLLTVAAGGLALTVYGWWEAPAPAMARPGAPQVVPPSQVAFPAVRLVDDYFQHRADDPMRALHLLAPEFHLARDLTLVRILGLPPLAPEPGSTPEDDRSLELARVRVAWLQLYNLIRWMQPVAGALDARVLEVDQRDDSAEVRVRVGSLTPPPPAGRIGAWPFPDFDQHFSLARRDGSWFITSIDQSGVSDANAVQAFVADPSLSGLEHLRALGWRPPWEVAIASVIPPAR